MYLENSSTPRKSILSSSLQVWSRKITVKEESPIRWSKGSCRTKDNEQNQGGPQSRNTTLARHSSKCRFGGTAKWLCSFQIKVFIVLILSLILHCALCVRGPDHLLFSLFPDQEESQRNLILG